MEKGALQNGCIFIHFVVFTSTLFLKCCLEPFHDYETYQLNPAPEYPPVSWLEIKTPWPTDITVLPNWYLIKNPFKTGKRYFERHTTFPDLSPFSLTTDKVHGWSILTPYTGSTRYHNTMFITLHPKSRNTFTLYSDANVVPGRVNLYRQNTSLYSPPSPI